MKPCKRCGGTGVWEPDHPSEHDDAGVVTRECYRCDGTGQVLTIEEEKAESKLEAKRRIFEPRTREREVGDEDGPEYTLEQFWAATQKWWAQDRARRIRQGACPVCAEKGCPKVGGKDAECVP